MLNAEEALSPFDVYYWSTHTGSYHTGHPRHSTPQYGVVDAGHVRHRAPIFVGVAEHRDAPSPRFYHVTDMQRRF